MDPRLPKFGAADDRRLHDARTRNGRDHGHRHPTRPHDASREPLAGWNGRVMARMSGGGDSG